MNCSNYFNCQLQEHLSQYNYSINNNYLNCSKKINNCYISLEQIVEQYIPLGFSHFSFTETENINNDFLFFLIDYFIKEEYKYEILKIFFKEELQ